MDKYKLIKDHLREILAVGQALGLNISRDGWYCTNQNMKMDPNLTPTDNNYVGPLCLIGVVGFVEGVDSPKHKMDGPVWLGLTLDETKSLETGFCDWSMVPDYVKEVPELRAIGKELAEEFCQ